MTEISTVFCENFNDSCDEVEFLIDSNTLRDCPLVKENVDIYNHLGGRVTKLRLVDVCEKDVYEVFTRFKCLRYLTLENVIIIHDEFFDYPMHLKSLVIRDCKINYAVAEQWLRMIGKSLRRIEITRSYYKLSLDHPEGSLAEPRFLALLPNVHHLSLNECGVLKYASASQQIPETPRLELLAKKCPSTGKLLFLKYLSFGVFDKIDDVLRQLDCKNTIKTLVLRNCPTNIATLINLTSLEHLRIFNSVTKETLEQLQKMTNIKILDVHCLEPPVIEDQLMRLDDDSLLTILSHLTLYDWIALHQTNSRLRYLVNRFMLPMAPVKICDKFVTKYPLTHHMDLYEDLGQNVRSLILSCDSIKAVLKYFVNLKKLYMPHRDNSPELFNLIPDGLEKLDLFIHHPDQSLANVFQRLNRTLTSLELCGGMMSEDLGELSNLRYLKLGGYTPVDLDLSVFLEKNKNHLELLEIKFYHPDEYDHLHQFDDPPPLGQERTLFSLCPLKNLRVLRLDSMSHAIPLYPSDFPALQEIRLSFDNYTTMAVVEALVNDIKQFTNLKILHINGVRDYRHLFCLKNLEELEIYEEFLPEGEVLEIVKNLPNLHSLGTENDTFSLTFEQELQDMLIKQRRKLFTMYHCVWSATKVRFGAADVEGERLRIK